MPEVFKLLCSQGSDLLDSISGDYEDSFSLDLFEDICHSHWKLKKSFVIARVQTVDPKQPEKEFYSYYDAYHLNKILFQTQIVLKKKYIHRLHVLNPLTNTDIIGNVQYFLLKPRAFKEKKEEEDSIGDDIKDASTTTTGNGYSNSRAMDSKDINGGKAANVVNDIDGFDLVSPSVKAIERGDKVNWTMKNHKLVRDQQDGEDEDKAMNTDAEKLAAVPLAAFLKNTTARSGMGSQNSSNSNILQYPIDALFPGNAAKLAAKKRHSLTLTAFLPNSLDDQVLDGPSLTTTATINDNKASSAITSSQHRSELSPGTVTQFSNPISAEKLSITIPKTQSGNRRALSYRNAISASTVPVSFLEWSNMIEREQELGLDCNPDFFDDLDLSLLLPATNAPPPATTTNTTAAAATNTTTSESAAATQLQQPSNPPKKTKKKVVVYDGLLFATDDDYLASSKIRKIFMDNALTPEDAKLFEMKEYTGEEEDGGGVGGRDGRRGDERGGGARRPHADIPLCVVQ